MCEQDYYGVVRCALGWACWKTYVGRPERDEARKCAMTQLGNGLSEANHHEDAISVYEAELAMKRRLGASEDHMLGVQNNVANMYAHLGQREKAASLMRDVYSGRLRLSGEESLNTLIAACNYASSLVNLQRFEETRSLLRKTMPVARRVLGELHEVTIKMLWIHADTLYMDADTTLDDLREAVITLENETRTARRVFGGANPLVVGFEKTLRNARNVLRARETQ